MDLPDNQAPQQTELGRLQEQCDALRQLVVSTLILLIVVSGTLTIFLLREYRDSRKQVEAFRTQVETVGTQFERGFNPIVARLMDFGSKHPDFLPILTRHNLKPMAAADRAPVGFPAPGGPGPLSAPGKK